MKFSQFNTIKCLAHKSKIESIIAGKFPAPVSLNLDLTNKCNYNCIWCYVSSFIKAKPVEMAINTALNIINSAANFGVKSILFTGGGEPTCHPQFLTAVNVAANRGLELGLTTNGSKLHTVVDGIPYKNFKYIRISFDAGTKETYAKVHNSKSQDFQNTLDSAKYISEHIGPECQLGMAYLVTPQNYREIPQALVLAEQYGFSYISIRPAVLKTILSKAQINEAVSICNTLKSGKVNIMPLTTRFEALQKREQFKCIATPLIAIVTADAKFNLCCQHRGKSEYQWGDLTKDSFETLWGSKEHMQMVADIDSAKCPLCRMISYNEIIEKVFVADTMHRNFL